MKVILLDLNQSKSELVVMPVNVRQTHRVVNERHLTRVWSNLWKTQKVRAQLLGRGHISSWQGLQEA